MIPVLGSQPAGDVSHKPGGYFPPGPQLPSQPLRGLLPVSLLGEQRHDGCEQFAWDCHATASRLRLEPRPFCAWVQHANQPATANAWIQRIKRRDSVDNGASAPPVADAAPVDCLAELAIVPQLLSRRRTVLARRSNPDTDLQHVTSTAMSPAAVPRRGREPPNLWLAPHPQI